MNGRDDLKDTGSSKSLPGGVYVRDRWCFPACVQIVSTSFAKPSMHVFCHTSKGAILDPSILSQFFLHNILEENIYSPNILSARFFWADQGSLKEENILRYSKNGRKILFIKFIVWENISGLDRMLFEYR